MRYTLQDLYKGPDVSNLREGHGDAEKVQILAASLSRQNKIFLNLRFIRPLNVPFATMLSLVTSDKAVDMMETALQFTGVPWHTLLNRFWLSSAPVSSGSSGNLSHRIKTRLDSERGVLAKEDKLKAAPPGSPDLRRTPTTLRP